MYKGRTAGDDSLSSLRGPKWTTAAGGYLFSAQEPESAVRRKCDFVHLVWTDGSGNPGQDTAVLEVWAGRLFSLVPMILIRAKR